MKVKLVLAFVLIVVLQAACASQSSDSPNIPSPSQTASPVEDDQIEKEPIFQEGTPTPIPTTDFRELEIVTLLPKDAIPAIDDPTFLSVDEADELYDPDELVIGVEFNGDARAYSVPFLSGHEIVNDTVGGVALSVTW